MSAWKSLNLLTRTFRGHAPNRPLHVGTSLARGLAETDPTLHKLITSEGRRQREGLELIASENFTSLSVQQVLGSCLTNKYSEGLPNARYYGGNSIIDQIELLCIERALTAFRLDGKTWGANVQPYSGSPANFAIYTALMKPGDRLMGMSLAHGGHLTHGHFVQQKDGTVKNISASSIYFQSKPYFSRVSDGRIDYDALAVSALEFKPKLIVCGYSAYPRDLDYKRFREIANSVGAYLLCDMSHFSGLVATQELANPFEYADVVSSTTHKTLRGPRSGIILFKKELEAAINFAVFPSLQGGPHNHAIAAVATQLLQVTTPEFKSYIQQVKKNSKALAAALVARGYTLCTGGTDNHLVLWDLRPLNLLGNRLELLCDAASITLNKNSVPGDISAMAPGGVRIGTPALTSRGFSTGDFEQVAAHLHTAVQIALKIQKENGTSLPAFKEAIKADPEVAKLREQVNKFANDFPMPSVPLL